MRIVCVLGIGTGVYAVVHYSGAEQMMVDYIIAQQYISLSSIRRYPFLISVATGAGAGLITTLFITALSSSRSPAKKRPVQENTGEGERKRGLYRDLHTCIQEYSKETHLQEDSAQNLYEARSRKTDFLKKISSLLLQQHIGLYEHSRFESGEFPELLSEEARELLQKAIYSNFAAFKRVAQPDILEQTDISWELFSRAVIAIGEFAFSIKSCFEFYLLACSSDRDRIDSLSAYGVLPIEMGTPHESELKRIEHDKMLGDKFNYALLDKFYRECGSLGMSFNPSIPDAFLFLDRCTEKIIAPLDYLLGRAKRLFVPFQLTRTEAYQRIEWIRNALHQGKIAPESARHFLDTFLKYEDECRKNLALLEINPETMPKGMITPEEFEKVRKVLEKMRPEGDKLRARAGPTEVIYQTGIHKKKKEVVEE